METIASDFAKGTRTLLADAVTTVLRKVADRYSLDFEDMHREYIVPIMTIATSAPQPPAPQPAAIAAPPPPPATDRTTKHGKVACIARAQRGPCTRPVFQGSCYCRLHKRMHEGETPEVAPIRKKKKTDAEPVPEDIGEIPQEIGDAELSDDEFMEALGEALGTFTEATESTTEVTAESAIEITIESTIEAPKAVPEAPKAVPEAPKAVPEAPKAVPEAPKAVMDALQFAKDLPNIPNELTKALQDAMVMPPPPENFLAEFGGVAAVDERIKKCLNEEAPRRRKVFKKKKADPRPIEDAFASDPEDDVPVSKSSAEQDLSLWENFVPRAQASSV
jgi:hypothetical protein